MIETYNCKVYICERYKNGKLSFVYTRKLKQENKNYVKLTPALVQIMTLRRQGDKPLFETMIVSLMAHICVSRPQ